MGLIVRTAGVGRNAEELQWDLDYLTQLWSAVEQSASERPAPFLIYQESDVIIRSIRDHLRTDIGEIVVDDRRMYEKADQFIRQVMPHNLKKLRLYDDEVPLFTRYQIESQIESAFQRGVQLPSGGSIVIDHTEALTSIDINSARATKGSDIEETALNTNLEAADEVARQLRLRDLGGLFVIDFIDMTPARNQREVENRLREALKQDRARVQVGRISRFGLLEMSRQRLRPSLGESSQLVCPRCRGQGTIRGVESLALSILRIVEEEAMKENTKRILAQLPVDVATFLLNEKRRTILDIEQRQDVDVILLPNEHLDTPEYRIERLRSQDVGRLPKEQASYELTAASETEPPSFARPPETGILEEPAVKQFAPAAPAPPPTARPEVPQRNEKSTESVWRRLWTNLVGHAHPDGENPPTDLRYERQRPDDEARRRRNGQSERRAAGKTAYQRPDTRPQTDTGREPGRPGAVQARDGERDRRPTAGAVSDTADRVKSTERGSRRGGRGRSRRGGEGRRDDGRRQEGQRAQSSQSRRSPETGRKTAGEENGRKPQPRDPQSERREGKAGEKPQTPSANVKTQGPQPVSATDAERPSTGRRPDNTAPDRTEECSPAASPGPAPQRSAAGPTQPSARGEDSASPEAAAPAPAGEDDAKAAAVPERQSQQQNPKDLRDPTPETGEIGLETDDKNRSGTGSRSTRRRRGGGRGRKKSAAQKGRQERTASETVDDTSSKDSRDGRNKRQPASNSEGTPQTQRPDPTPGDTGLQTRETAPEGQPSQAISTVASAQAPAPTPPQDRAPESAPRDGPASPPLRSVPKRAAQNDGATNEKQAPGAQPRLEPAPSPDTKRSRTAADAPAKPQVSVTGTAASSPKPVANRETGGTSEGRKPDPSTTLAKNDAASGAETKDSKP
jgi:ribonuclease E